MSIRFIKQCALPTSNGSIAQNQRVRACMGVRLCSGKVLINRLRPEELLRCAVFFLREWGWQRLRIVNLDWLCLLMFSGLVWTCGVGDPWVIGGIKFFF